MSDRGTPSFEAGQRWQPRVGAELQWVLGVGYGRPVDLESRMGALRVVADALYK